MFLFPRKWMRIKYFNETHTPYVYKYFIRFEMKVVLTKKNCFKINVNFININQTSFFKKYMRLRFHITISEDIISRINFFIHKTNTP